LSEEVTVEEGLETIDEVPVVEQEEEEGDVVPIMSI
jgi:hypothetical protein